MKIALNNQQIEFSVIGIGLNVNQEIFEGLPKVSSLKHILGMPVSKEELLHKLIENMQHYFRLFSEKGVADFQRRIRIVFVQKR